MCHKPARPMSMFQVAIVQRQLDVAGYVPLKDIPAQFLQIDTFHWDHGQWASMEAQILAFTNAIIVRGNKIKQSVVVASVPGKATNELRGAF